MSQTLSMTYTLTSPKDVVITTPTYTISKPGDYPIQAALNAAIVAWAGRASVSGGCDPQLSNNAATDSVLCTGGVTTITWADTDLCMSPTLTRTLTVTAPEDVVITAPADILDHTMCYV